MLTGIPESKQANDTTRHASLAASTPTIVSVMRIKCSETWGVAQMLAPPLQQMGYDASAAMLSMCPRPCAPTSDMAATVMLTETLPFLTPGSWVGCSQLLAYVTDPNDQGLICCPLIGPAFLPQSLVHQLESWAGHCVVLHMQDSRRKAKFGLSHPQKRGIHSPNAHQNWER